MAGNGNGNGEAKAPRKFSLSRAERDWIADNTAEGQALAKQMQDLQAARQEVVGEILDRLGIKAEVEAGASATLSPDHSTLTVGERRATPDPKVIEMPEPKASTPPPTPAAV